MIYSINEVIQYVKNYKESDNSTKSRFIISSAVTMGNTRRGDIHTENTVLFF